MAFNIRKQTFWIISFLLFLLVGCGSVKSKLKKADKHFKNGEYAVAGKLYKSAYSRISYKKRELRGKTAFQQGECYRHINYYRAEQVYKNAVRNKYSDSIVFLRLAQAQHKNGKYKNAIKNYKIFLTYKPNDTIANNGLRGALFVDSLFKNRTRYKIKKMKKFKASRSTTFSPAFTSSEADALTFTSNRKLNKKDKKRKKNKVSGVPNNHIFIVKKNNKGKWEKPKPIEGEILSPNDEGVTSFTANGRSMYFTRSITEGDNGGQGSVILVSERSGGDWSTPKQIALFKDSTISVAHPAISPDGNTLYFVSDAPNGYGGMDIWKAEKSDEGTWSFIENLGAEINTAEDELFPVVRENGKLYFSSTGHSGLGGLDIFEAVPIDTIKEKIVWKVSNMGVPLNSSADDFGMTFAGNKNYGYFCSGRKEHRGYDAIWSFVLPDIEYILEGKIKDKNGNSAPIGRVSIVGNNGENARFRAKGDGTFQFKMKRGVSYAVMVSARGFLNMKDTISTYKVSEKESQTFYREYFLRPIFESARLDNIYYDFDKSTIRPNSKTELDSLVRVLKDNPNVTIEMSSHTDYKGEFVYNRELSFKRVQAVVDYLIKSGIEPARLTAEGYGEGKPFTIDPKHNRQYPFLPLEQVLTEEFIQTLEPEQQEIANQINRRTEFRVTSTTYNLY